LTLQRTDLAMMPPTRALVHAAWPAFFPSSNQLGRYRPGGRREQVRQGLRAVAEVVTGSARSISSR
jgi:hypothetical protein